MTSPHLPGAVQMPDGSWVRGRSLRHPPPAGAFPDHGLYLGTHRLRRRYEDELSWPHQWIDWPDFLVPRDGERAVHLIKGLRDAAHAGQQIEVACGGGVGRTGTVIACLAILAGIPPPDAVAWTRTNYHPRAVETPWQRRWVLHFPHT